MWKCCAAKFQRPVLQVWIWPSLFKSLSEKHDWIFEPSWSISTERCSSSRRSAAVYEKLQTRKSPAWPRKPQLVIINRMESRMGRATNFPLLGKFSLQLGSNIGRNLTSMLLALVIHLILAWAGESGTLSIRRHSPWPRQMKRKHTVGKKTWEEQDRWRKIAKECCFYTFARLDLDLTDFVRGILGRLRSHLRSHLRSKSLGMKAEKCVKRPPYNPVSFIHLFTHRSPFQHRSISASVHISKDFYFCLHIKD